MVRPKHDFLLGCLGYPLLELAYRGRTHWTMSVVGGCSLSLLRCVQKRYAKRPLWERALRGGLIITGLEYVVGRILNRDYRIWDYRHMPLSLHGQICLPYTLCWCALSGAILALYSTQSP